MITRYVLLHYNHHNQATVADVADDDDNVAAVADHIGYRVVDDDDNGDRSVWAPFSSSTDGGDGFTLLFGVATKLWTICVTSYASRADEGCSPAAL
jgi:hypothetical protein